MILQSNNQGPGNSLSAYIAQPSAGQSDASSKFSPMQKQILSIMTAENAFEGTEGIHVAVIARQMGGDPHAIRSVCASSTSDISN